MISFLMLLAFVPTAFGATKRTAPDYHTSAYLRERINVSGNGTAEALVSYLRQRDVRLILPEKVRQAEYYLAVKNCPVYEVMDGLAGTVAGSSWYFVEDRCWVLATSSEAAHRTYIEATTSTGEDRRTEAARQSVEQFDAVVRSLTKAQREKIDETGQLPAQSLKLAQQQMLNSALVLMAKSEVGQTYNTPAPRAAMGTILLLERNGDERRIRFRYPKKVPGYNGKDMVLTVIPSESNQGWETVESVHRNVPPVPGVQPQLRMATEEDTTVKFTLVFSAQPTERAESLLARIATETNASLIVPGGEWLEQPQTWSGDTPMRILHAIAALRNGTWKKAGELWVLVPRP